MFITPVMVGPLQQNAYIVACEDTKEAVVIDPGDEAERIAHTLTSYGFTLKLMMNTHGHLDHIGAVADLAAQTSAPFLLHRADLYLIEDVASDPLYPFFPAKQPPMPTRFLADGERISVGSLEFQILHTPGHTPGSVCFLVEQSLFSGDTLFSGSVGRTDLPGGNTQQLLTSIREKILTLDDAVRVYPGHGRVTTVGIERAQNPFL